MSEQDVPSKRDRREHSLTLRTRVGARRLLHGESRRGTGSRHQLESDARVAPNEPECSSRFRTQRRQLLRRRNRQWYLNPRQSSLRIGGARQAAVEHRDAIGTSQLLRLISIFEGYVFVRS